MDEELTAVRSPHGVAVRYLPGAVAGLWHEAIELPGSRLGLAVGHSADPARAARLRSEVQWALREAAKPGHVPAMAERLEPASGATAVCGVVDRANSTITVTGLGDSTPVIALPDKGFRALEAPAGALTTATLPPGATVLLCTALAMQSAGLLDGCSTAHPDRAADHLIGQLSGSPGLVALLYRHPPAPLELTVAADPTSLATVRNHLRQWLTLAGVAPEPAADTVLAVGEAASNAAEHAVAGARSAVELRVRAEIVDGQLRCTVADDGVWKSPAATSGSRGHGIRLINALVDTAEVTTDGRGTTVEMRKGLSG